MAKQVVTEKWIGDSVKIILSYGFDSDLVGKKQFEEVVKILDNDLQEFGVTEKIKIVKHWVRVPDNVPAGPAIKNTRAADKVEVKKVAKQQYWDNRREKINKKIIEYRTIVENGGVLFGCERDDCFGF